MAEQSWHGTTSRRAHHAPWLLPSPMAVSTNHCTALYCTGLPADHRGSCQAPESRAVSVEQGWHGCWRCLSSLALSCFTPLGLALTCLLPAQEDRKPHGKQHLTPTCQPLQFVPQLCLMPVTQAVWGRISFEKGGCRPAASQGTVRTMRAGTGALAWGPCLQSRAGTGRGSGRWLHSWASVSPLPLSTLAGSFFLPGE